jgi:hypothetical protein
MGEPTPKAQRVEEGGDGREAVNTPDDPLLGAFAFCPALAGMMAANSTPEQRNELYRDLVQGGTARVGDGEMVPMHTLANPAEALKMAMAMMAVQFSMVAGCTAAVCLAGGTMRLLAQDGNGKLEPNEGEDIMELIPHIMTVRGGELCCVHVTDTGTPTDAAHAFAALLCTWELSRVTADGSTIVFGKYGALPVPSAEFATNAAVTLNEALTTRPAEGAAPATVSGAELDALTQAAHAILTNGQPFVSATLTVEE